MSSNKIMKRTLSNPTVRFVNQWLNELEAEEKDGIIESFEMFNDLIGEIVLSISVSDTYDAIAFKCQSGKIVTFQTYTECCSETYISDFYGFSKLINHQVLSVTEVSLDENDYNVKDGRERQEYDQVYGYKFNTVAGCSILSFRNSSNGFYGGDLNRVQLDSTNFETIKPKKKVMTFGKLIKK